MIGDEIAERHGEFSEQNLADVERKILSLEQCKAELRTIAVPADDAAAAELEAELIAYTRERLADVKAPRSIDFREELPRHPTGKLYKRLLQREELIRMGYDPDAPLSERTKKV